MTRKAATLSAPGVCLTVAALATALAACSSREPSRAPASTSTPSPATSRPATPTNPAPTVTDSVQGAVLAAYRGYWAARVKAQAAPDQPPPAELDRYAIGAASAGLKATVLTFRQQGIAFRGEPVLSPVVTVTRSGDDGTASVADCIDSSHWTPVFVASGRSALAPGQALRVEVTSTARVYAGHWVIDSSVAHRDRPC